MASWNGESGDGATEDTFPFFSGAGDIATMDPEAEYDPNSRRHQHHLGPRSLQVCRCCRNIGHPHRTPVQHGSTSSHPRGQSEQSGSTSAVTADDRHAIEQSYQLMKEFKNNFEHMAFMFQTLKLPPEETRAARTGQLDDLLKVYESITNHRQRLEELEAMIYRGKNLSVEERPGAESFDPAGCVINDISKEMKILGEKIERLKSLYRVTEHVEANTDENDVEDREYTNNAIYSLITSVKDSEWKHLMRCLSLTHSEMDNITAKYCEDPKEQKFRMMKLWIKKERQKGVVSLRPALKEAMPNIELKERNRMSAPPSLCYACFGVVHE